VRPVWLVTPTFNEADSIETLVRESAARLEAAAPGAWHLLVVDDASPDGTGELAERVRTDIPRLEVLHRAGKGGLGRAYLAGFERALAGGAGAVVQMDADLSHQPADIPRLLDALESADVVLGSRYVPGGEIRDWGPMRRAVSRAGCSYARRVLGIGIRDLTGGFKAYRREVLEAIDLPSIRSEGYVFQIELTYRALRRGFRVRELPIVFSERRSGQSKMSTRIALEAALLVPRLRWQRQE
jgi:dolichol-phosphate mannosyltransferase